MIRRAASNKLTEKTLIPVSMVVTIGGVIFWVGSLAARVEAVERDRDDQLSARQRFEQTLSDLKAVVNRIDGKTDYIYDQIKRN